MPICGGREEKSEKRIECVAVLAKSVGAGQVNFANEMVDQSHFPMLVFRQRLAGLSANSSFRANCIPERKTTQAEKKPESQRNNLAKELLKFVCVPAAAEFFFISPYLRACPAIVHFRSGRKSEVCLSQRALNQFRDAFRCSWSWSWSWSCKLNESEEWGMPCTYRHRTEPGGNALKV